MFLIAADGSLLLQQRSDDVPPAGIGRWTPPGGAREPGEDPRATALREFEEETGIRLERLRYLETVTPGEVEGLFVDVLHVFYADDDVPRERIQVFEGLDFQYRHPREFAEMPFNPGTRHLIERFPERYPNQWSIPGGLIEEGEAPDAAAFREFEEETGQVLDNLEFFRLYRREPDLPTSLTDVYHVYYIDADIDEDRIVVGEGQAFRYFAPDELAGVDVPVHARTVLAEFLASGAYRAMFH